MDWRDLQAHTEMLRDDIATTRCQFDRAVGVVVNINATSDPVDYAEVALAYTTVAELAQQLQQFTDELHMVEAAVLEQDLQRMVSAGTSFHPELSQLQGLTHLSQGLDEVGNVPMFARED